MLVLGLATVNVPEAALLALIVLGTALGISTPRPIGQVSPATFEPVVQTTSPPSTFERYGAYGLALYLLATTRWGSGLSLNGEPPYVSDLILGALLLTRLWAYTVRQTVAPPIDPRLRLLMSALLAWCVLELIVGSISQNALRDAAPYFYAVLIFLVRPADISAETAAKLATYALIFHASWVTLTILFPALPYALPAGSTGIHLLELRPDIDGTVCGLLATLSLYRAITTGSRLSLVLFAWGAVLVLSLYDRASLLSFIAQLFAVALLIGWRSAGSRTPDRRTIIAIAAFCLPIVAFPAIESTPVQRLLASAKQTPQDATLEGAGGRAHARLAATKVVSQYLERNQIREFAGVGFGPNFLHESGGDVALLGGYHPEVRAPHNYLLNSWARLGLIGVSLALAVLLLAFRLGRGVMRRARTLRDDDVLAFLIVVSIPVAAIFGVVLESPFGAIPYFWAVGHLGVRAQWLRSHGAASASRQPRDAQPA